MLSNDVPRRFSNIHQKSQVWPRMKKRKRQETQKRKQKGREGEKKMEADLME